MDKYTLGDSYYKTSCANARNGIWKPLTKKEKSEVQKGVMVLENLGILSNMRNAGNSGNNLSGEKSLQKNYNEPLPPTDFEKTYRIRLKLLKGG
jgi:hypothetical protein